MALLGHWPLGDANGLSLLDIGGSNRTLSQDGTASNFRPCGDLVVGERALQIFGTGNRLMRSDAALRLSGELTVCARVFWSNNSNAQHAVSCSDSPSELEANNHLYALGVSAGGLLAYDAEYGSGTNVTYTSSLALLQGLWTFIALRRNAAGTVVTLTRGLSDANSNVHETSGTLTAPTGGSTSPFSIGNLGEHSTFQWVGGIKAVKLWSHALTDAELETERAAAMLTGDVDDDPPVIENVSPAAPGPIAIDDSLEFDLDDESGFALTELLVRIGDRYDIAYADGDFRDPYADSSISSGHYTVTREGGWPAGHRIALRILAVDAAGNVAVLDA